MAVSAGDMKGRLESTNVGYNGMHGGYGYRARKADGSEILQMG